MKTLVSISNNKSLYILEDNEPVNFKEDSISFGNPEHTFVPDCNFSNTKIIENISPPEDWDGGKYYFNDGNWVVSQDWLDSQPPAEEVITEQN